jgi:hypothetical protein
MILSLDKAGASMKRVYLLLDELKDDPEQIALAQALTLNLARPMMGLKGTHGLFGSSEWWASIEQRKMPLLYVSGIIRRAYIAGQDDDDENNTVSLLMEDGAEDDVGIYVNDKVNACLFKVGHRVELVYVLDELKMQPAPGGGINYSKIALEMTVSSEPALALQGSKAALPSGSLPTAPWWKFWS